MSSTRTKSRVWRLAILVVGLLAVLAATAAAGQTSVYCTGSLPPGWGCAGNDAHSDYLYVFATSDHTVCPSLAVGYAGYTPVANSYNTVVVGTCGYGNVTGGAYVGSSYYHGAVWNQNQSTYDNISNAYMIFCATYCSPT